MCQFFFLKSTPYFENQDYTQFFFSPWSKHVLNKNEQVPQLPNGKYCYIRKYKNITCIDEQRFPNPVKHILDQIECWN